jgi:hypothetical protein
VGERRGREREGVFESVRGEGERRPREGGREREVGERW